jgi:hypothetical protein
MSTYTRRTNLKGGNITCSSFEYIVRDACTESVLVTEMDDENITGLFMCHTCVTATII